MRSIAAAGQLCAVARFAFADQRYAKRGQGLQKNALLAA